ncbi:MAG: hypothetical protein AAF235_10610, partial [Planctomycetota bacterium]
MRGPGVGDADPRLFWDVPVLRASQGDVFAEATLAEVLADFEPAKPRLDANSGDAGAGDAEVRAARDLEALRRYSEGRFRRLSGDLPGAIASLRRAVSLGGSVKPAAHREIAAAFRAAGRLEPASAALGEAVSSGIREPVALAAAGSALMGSGDPEGAAGVLARAIRESDVVVDEAFDIVAYGALGEALFDLGRLRAAAACFDRAFARPPRL